MATIVVGSYMIRYPLGGMLSWVLQYLVGLQRLGHEVWFVEKSGYSNSCFDPERNRMSDDCSYGAAVVDELLGRFGMSERWCYVDAAERYWGADRRVIERVFARAAAFIDMGTHGAWLQEAAAADCTILIDGEPGFTQMKMALRRARGEQVPTYDHYFTTGRNIAVGVSDAPAAECDWRPIFHPVVCDLFTPSLPRAGAPLTTIMNWQSYAELDFEGASYGHKDLEFERFASLPNRVAGPFELAVSGKSVPEAWLIENGWRLCSGPAITQSVAAFQRYIRDSRAEFGVVKHGFAATRSGWFSDRSAAYLATGRPVVLVDTGFSNHLPCGEGLFAVRDADDACAAIEQIDSDLPRHSRAARRIAEEYLDARTVLGGALAEVGVA